MTSANRALRVQSVCATTDNLRSVLNKGVRVLHFSGHGLVDGRGIDWIVFEDVLSQAHFIDALTLSRFVRAGKHSLELVFLGCCHSRRIGEAFIQAGVKHVVCVHRDSRILDSASTKFATSFYNALFCGSTEQSVRQAFETARLSVMTDPSIADGKKEVEKFQLLPASGDHSETLLTKVQTGPWVDMTATPKFSTTELPKEPTDFVGRVVDMFKLAKLVAENRLVTLKGPPGIGKTSLCRAVLSHISERRLFSSGIVWVPLRAITSHEAVVAAVLRAVARASGEMASLELSGAGVDLSARAVSLTLRDEHVLLVLDNAEDSLSEDGAKIGALAQNILEACPTVSLLLTSRRSIGGCLAGLTEKVHQLGPLHAIEAARLLEHRCPRKVLLQDLQYASGSGNPHPEEGGNVNPMKALAQHPVLTLLGGHPQAISLTAPLLEHRSLQEVHDLLSTKSIDVLQPAAVPKREQSSSNSLAVSLEVSLDHLRKECGEDPVRVFALFGVLPGGTSLEELNEIWGSDCTDHVQALLRASLVNSSNLNSNAAPSTKLIWTFPHFSQYARSLMSPEDEHTLGVRAASHYSSLAESLLKPLEDSTSLASVNWEFAKAEPNYWKVLELVESASKPDEHKLQKGLHVSCRLAANLASILFFEGRLADCLLAAESGVITADKVGDQLGMAHSLKIRGVARSLDKSKQGHRGGSFELAKEDLGNAQIRYHAEGVPLGDAITRLALAEVLMHMQQLTGAKTCYERSLKLFTQLMGSTHHATEGRLECHRWLATVCKKLGLKDESRQHYEEAAKLQRMRKSTGVIFPHMFKLIMPSGENPRPKTALGNTTAVQAPDSKSGIPLSRARSTPEDIHKSRGISRPRSRGTPR